MKPTPVGLIAILMWAASGLLVSLTASIPPFQLMTITWLMGFFFLIGWNVLRKKPIRGEWKRPLSDYALVFTGITGYTVLYYFAFRHAPPFEANTLNYLWPILLIIFIGFFDKEPFSFLKILGMFLGFAGCVLLLGVRAGGFSFGGIQSGHIIAISGAFIWAFYSALAGHKSYTSGFMLSVYLVSTLFCLGLHFLTETWQPLSVEILPAVFILGFSRISYALWDYGIRNGDKILLTSVCYFVPLLSALLLIAGGFGTSHPLILLSALLVISGCLVVNAKRIHEAFRRRRIMS